jgi:RHS repeat-associated protein
VDEIIARATPATISYYHYDALGSTTALTDSNGTVTERYRYDVYGVPAFFDSTSQPLNSSAIGNRFLFTGRENLSELRLYDYRNRIYSPALGRFFQSDPLRFTARDVNLYRYAGNSVLISLDPLGLFSCEDLCSMESNALDMADARLRQLDALDDDDSDKWWDIEKSQVPIGHYGVNTGHNPAVDAFEKNPARKAIVDKWFWQGIGFSFNRSDYMREKSTWEAETAGAAALWAKEQIEQQGCDCDCELKQD